MHHGKKEEEYFTECSLQPDEHCLGAVTAKL